jgi:integrase
MSIYPKKGTGRFLFDFDKRIKRPDGPSERVRRRLLLPAGWTRAQADAYDRKESAALYALATGIAKPRHLIDQAVTCYGRERAADLKAGANALREIEAMRDWWAGRPIEDLPAVCSEYAADQHGALQPATIKNRIAYLRAACRWAWKRHGMGDSDPGARVVAPTVRNARETVISRLEMLTLARACPHRGVRALIRVLFYTGFRVGEAQRAERRGGVFVLHDTKNAEPHVLPIDPRIATAARVPMPPRSVIDYWWPLTRKLCGMEHVRLHDIRHSTASEIISAGGDLGDVGAVLNHKSAASSRRYAHWLLKRKAAALAKVGRKVA